MDALAPPRMDERYSRRQAAEKGRCQFWWFYPVQ
jgi:hypothetical protein